VIIPKYLECSIDYRRLALDDIELFKVVNGCGAAGSKFDFVADTVYGLSIKQACFIHDFDYSVGKTLEDKYAADSRFLDNMLAIIHNESTWFLKWPRRLRAMSYYSAVCDMGYSAFWAGKKHPVHTSDTFAKPVHKIEI
jgi:hypothetical protein